MAFINTNWTRHGLKGSLLPRLVGIWVAVMVMLLAPMPAIAQPAEKPMPSPAAQSVAALGNTGVPLLVTANGDLIAKEGTAQDSWFVISHLTADENSALDLMVHYIRLTPAQGEPFVQAIVSVLDPVSGKSIAEEKVYPVLQTTFSTKSLDVRTPSGAISGNAESMRVTGDFSKVSVDLTLKHQGALLANVGNGLLPFYSDINYEYALPSMATTGSVTIDGKRYKATGSSWFDRQWGQMAAYFWNAHQWSWMGISLDNGDRISLWDILDSGKEQAFATILHPDGRHELVDIEPLAKGATQIWTSEATEHRYPTRWSVSIPSLQAHFDVEPRVREQEVVSPIEAHKYEGASTVSGEMLGKPVTGYAVVELVGDWT